MEPNAKKDYKEKRQTAAPYPAAMHINSQQGKDIDVTNATRLRN